MKFLLKVFKVVIALIIILVTAYFIYVPFENRKLIRNYLNLSELPSVSSAECEDYGFTDILVKCYFEISHEDFPALFKGRVWVSSLMNACGGGPVIGKAFAVTTTSSVRLTDEKNGGSIDVCYNRDMNKVLIHYYVE